MTENMAKDKVFVPQVRQNKSIQILFGM